MTDPHILWTPTAPPPAPAIAPPSTLAVDTRGASPEHPVRVWPVEPPQSVESSAVAVGAADGGADQPLVVPVRLTRRLLDRFASAGMMPNECIERLARAMEREHRALTGPQGRLEL